VNQRERRETDRQTERERERGGEGGERRGAEENRRELGHSWLPDVIVEGSETGACTECARRSTEKTNPATRRIRGSAHKNPGNSRESHNLTVTSPTSSAQFSRDRKCSGMQGREKANGEDETSTRETETHIERERERERDSADEIYSLPSARCINNDIGVFTSTHAPERVREGGGGGRGRGRRLLYPWPRSAIYNSPRRESCTLNRVNGGIDTYRPVRRHALRRHGLLPLPLLVPSFLPPPLLSLSLSLCLCLCLCLCLDFLAGAQDSHVVVPLVVNCGNLPFAINAATQTPTLLSGERDYRGLSFI